MPAMNEQENHHDVSADHDDLNVITLAPAIEMPSPGKQASGGWVMPKPVFRQSSGQPAVRESKQIISAEHAADDKTHSSDGSESWDSDQPTEFAPIADDIDDMAAAQPELADIMPYEPVSAEFVAASPVSQEKKSSSGLLMFIVAAVFAIGFIALLLTVVYYLFLRPAGT